MIATVTLVQHAPELNVPQFLVVLTATLVGAKLIGELAERLGQPAVLGELIAGVLLGASFLGVVPTDSQALHLLAEIGVIVLLFQIGLETDLKKLMSVGGSSFMVAVVGVFLPFLLGFWVARSFGVANLPAIVIGASLTATSVGITARVFSDLGRLRDPEGQVVLGAAVIDDVIGLIILAVVARLVAGELPTVLGIGRLTAVAFGFLGISIVIGRWLVLPLFRRLARLGRPESLAIMGLAFAFLLAVLADAAGSALIIGAFAAGLVLQPSEYHEAIESGVVRVGHFFVPIFFVSVGAAVDVTVFTDARIVLLGLALLLVAIAGKFAAGYAAWWFRGRKAVVGVGMIPRGEVGLIFAQMGLTAAVFDAALYSSVMVMVIGTTFLAPPVLKRMLGARPGDPEDPGGLSQLMSES